MNWLQDGDGNEQSLAVMAGEGMEHTVAALQSGHGRTQVFLRSAQSVSPSDIAVDHHSDSKLMFAKEDSGIVGIQGFRLFRLLGIPLGIQDCSGIFICLTINRLPIFRAYRTNM